MRKEPYLLARLTRNQGEYAAMVARVLILNNANMKITSHPDCYLIMVYCNHPEEYTRLAQRAHAAVPEANIL